MSDEDSPIPAIIVNPVKVAHLEQTKQRFTEHCADRGWSEPLWFETTQDDPGTGQAELAVRHEADVVIAMGGDGTVRAVAEGLRDTGVAMGIVPLGTGNMLARNLRLPLNDRIEALDVALGGNDFPLDIALLSYTTESGAQHDTMFLVMAGVGFDAEIMGNTPDSLKSYLGPGAYAITGLKRMLGPTSNVQVSTADDRVLSRRVKTVVVGNAGELPGRVSLLPDAKLDDGQLDAIIIGAHSINGWAHVAANVIVNSKDAKGLRESLQSSEFTVSCKHPMPLQLDGDYLATVTHAKFSADKHALVLRVPPEGPYTSVLDEVRTLMNAERARSGLIDLRPFDGRK